MSFLEEKSANTTDNMVANNNKPGKNEQPGPSVPIEPDRNDSDLINPEIGDPQIEEPKAKKEEEEEDFGVC